MKAVIFGAAGGCGAACVAKFVGMGVDVLAIDINTHLARGCCTEYVGANKRRCTVTWYQADVRDRASIGAALTEAQWHEFDAMVYAVGNNKPGFLATQGREELMAMYDLNVVGFVNAANECSTRMRHAPLGGKIVHVVSNSAVKAWSACGGYCASKAAAAHITRVLAKEMWRDFRINVNAINTSTVEGTPLTDRLREVFKAMWGWKTDDEARKNMVGKIPIGRFCQAGELADAAAFLCGNFGTTGSDCAANYMMGATITLDGGEAL